MAPITTTNPRFPHLGTIPPPSVVLRPQPRPAPRAPRTYYVDNAGNDANDGLSPATAWATLVQVMTVGIVDGDIILLKGGQNHAGGLTINIGATPTIGVTISSYGDGRGTIVPADLALEYAITIVDSSNVTIDNINIQGSGTTITGTFPRASAIWPQTAIAGLIFWGTTVSTWYEDLVIRNCNIDGCYRGLFAYNQQPDATAYCRRVTLEQVHVTHCGQTGIEFTGAAYGDVHSPLRIYDGITIRQCSTQFIYGDTATTDMGTGYGIIILGDGGGCLIERCYTSDNAFCSYWNVANGPTGIMIGYCDHGIIRECECHNQYEPAAVDGNGIDTDQYAVDCLVERCYIANCDGEGLLVYTNSNRSVFRHCIVQNCGRHVSSDIRGLAVRAQGDATFVHCSFYGQPTITRRLLIETSGLHCTYINNIFGIRNNGTFGSIGAATLIGNCYYVGSGSSFLLNIDGADYLSFASMLGSGYEQIGGTPHGLVANPLWRDPDTFAPQWPTTGTPTTFTGFDLDVASPALNTALDAATLLGVDVGATDFRGNPIYSGEGTGFSFGATQTSGPPIEPPIEPPTDITIVNPSFENPVLAPGGYTINDVPGWQPYPPTEPDSAFQAGVFRPNSFAATDGAQVALIASGYLYQTLAATLQADTVYTLQADLIARPEEGLLWPGASLDLIAGGTVLATNVIAAGALAPGATQTLTVTYTTSASDATLGQPLSVRFYVLTEGSQIVVDNVRLSAAPVVPIVPGATITGVARPVAEVTNTLTILGSGFSDPPTVTITDPDGAPIDVEVEHYASDWIVIQASFPVAGTYTVTVDDSAPYHVDTVDVQPIVTALDPPTIASTTPQQLTIIGTDFPDPPLVIISTPGSEVLPVTIVSHSATSITVSGIFAESGPYLVRIDSSPGAVAWLVGSITSVTPRPQAGLPTPQRITIRGAGFNPPLVTITGPQGEPIDVTPIDYTYMNEIVVDAVFPEDGIYEIRASYSAPYPLEAIPFPRITAITPPQSGLTMSQSVTLTGTGFPVPPSVTVTGPDGTVPVTVTVSTDTSITVTGVFLTPGAYTFTVGISESSTVQALPPAPPIITDVTRPQAGLTSPQTLTLTTTGYLTGPLVTVLGPDGLSIPVTLVSAPSAPLGGPVTVQGIFSQEGTYAVSVDGSDPFFVDALPIIAVITAVTPRPLHGVEDQQTVIVEGLHFSPSPTVRVTDPQGHDVPVTILSRTTITLTVSGVFLPEGTYWFYVDNSAGFPVQTVAPPATITHVTPPQAGLTDPQLLTITGTNFSDNPIVTVTDPYGNPVAVNVISASGTTVVIRGVFLQPGRYTFTVDDSGPFSVDAIPAPPPPPFITHPIRRMRQFVLPTSPDHRRMFISRLELLMRTGIGLTSGKGSDPQVMMQLSRDGGKTWSAERWRSAGETADYLRRVRWLREGHYRDGVIRFVMSDPVDWQLLSLSGDLTEGSN